MSLLDKIAEIIRGQQLLEKRLAQLEENLGSVGWALSPDEMARLNAASDIPLPSPYDFIARYTRKRNDG